MKRCPSAPWSGMPLGSGTAEATLSTVLGAWPRRVRQLRTSITAIATACHEAGHACQFAQGYTPMTVRGALVPAVNLASNAWVFLLMIGIILNIAGLRTLAIVMYVVVVLFQLVTLPVEFNASHRAMDYLSGVGVVSAERKGAFNVLRACALTYVAAALISVLQLLWLLGQREE